MDIGATKERANRIFFVETALREVNQKKRLLDYNAFWIEISEKWTVSERTAKEYINIAKSRIKEWMNDTWAQPSKEESKGEI